MRNYDPGAYERLNDPIAQWSAISARQRDKDQLLIPRLARHLRPGRVLELGSGTGDMALLLRSLGFDVVASDFHMFFVEHQRSRGLQAHQVDATDIAAAGLGRFANVFAHSITPLISHDEDITRRTYRSVYDTLEDGGVFLMVHGMEPWRRVGWAMRRHEAMARDAGFSSLQLFRNQLLPSPAYRMPLRPVTAVLESLLGTSLGSRFILVGTR